MLVCMFENNLFDGNGSQILYHRLTQSISSENDELGELENELEWQVWPELSLYSDTIYDHQLDSVTKQVTSLSYHTGGFTGSLSHFFEDNTRRNQSNDSSYMTSALEYRHDKHYRYFAQYAYDLENRIKKNAQVGFLYSKRCWDFGLRYVEINRPILQNGGVANSIYDKYIYFTIILKPMGGSEFQYQLNDMLEDS